MLKRKVFLKQSLAVLLSLTMSLGPCAPVSFAASAGDAGVEASADAGSEAEAEEASGADETNSESEEADTSGEEAADDDAEENETGFDEEASDREASVEEASDEDQPDGSAADTASEDQNGAETTEENVTADENGAEDDDQLDAETGADAETDADAGTGADAETDADAGTGADADAGTGVEAETDSPAETAAAETDPAAEAAAETEETQAESEAQDLSTSDETSTAPETEATEPETEAAETTEAGAAETSEAAAVENEAETAASNAVMDEFLEATVEDMQVTVSYEKGVFPENVTLDVQLIDQESEDQMEIEGKVLEAFNRGAEEDENYAAVNTQALDIRILDTEGKEVQPDTDKGKVYVSVSDIDRPLDQDGNAVPDKALHVFHMADAGDEDAEELEKIETGEETLLSGDLLAAEGAVINDLNTQEAAAEEDSEGSEEKEGEEAGEEELPGTAAVTVEAEHFSLYVLSWKVGSGGSYFPTALYDKNTYLIVNMINNGDMLDDHGFENSFGDKLNAVQLISGGDVISLNTSDSDHSKWTVTTKRTGRAVFNVNYSTVNGGKTATWVSQIKVEVKYFAEGTTSGMCGVDVRWSLSGTTLTISGSGDMYDYTPPAGGYADTSPPIAPWAAYTKKITAVNIGAGITSVGEYAFYQFEKLSSVTLPSGLEKIGFSAFENAAALKSLTLPATLTEIEGFAFNGCNELGNITIPAGVTYIGSYSFYKTKMASNKTKNVITNNSSEKMYGLHDYNQNYSTCPTGIIESPTTQNDKTPPSVVSVTVSNVTERNAEYKAVVRDNLNNEIKLYGFVTTEDSVTDPERVLQGGDILTDLDEYSATVTSGSGYYEYSMEFPDFIFIYYQAETRLTPNTTYYFYVVAEDSSGNASGIYKTSFKTTAENSCLTPKVSLDSGTYTGDQSVTLTPRTAGSSLYYQLNDGGWKQYTAPITLSASNRYYSLYVKAEKAGLEASHSDYYSYTIIDPTAALSGNCGNNGNNVTWKLIHEGADKTSPDDYTLEISGTGAMQGYSTYSSAPWYPYKSSIRHIRIKNGVTLIGRYAFYGLNYVEGELVIPDSVTTIGYYGCANMSRVTKLKLGSGVTTIVDYGLAGLDSVGVITVPSSVKWIGRGIFMINYYEYLGPGDKQQIISYSEADFKSSEEAGENGHYNEGCQRLRSDSTVRPFVRRMYEVCMGRTPDTDGLNYWTQQVLNGKYQGIGLAANFVFSKEFTGKNYCNEHFVRQIYPALMGRNPDTDGFNFWVGQLDSGKMSREALLNSFASTNEYKDLCDKAGFALGQTMTVPKYGTQQYGPCAVCGKKSKVVQFVERMYTDCLGRAAETGGLKYWSEALCRHTQTAKSLLHNFFLSKEMKDKYLTNEEYIWRIYRAMLNRDPDPSGLQYWKGRLDKGESPSVVINGFIDSSEFVKLCNDYGIQRK